MTTNWKIIDLKSQIADGLVTKVIYECRVRLDSIITRKVEEITLTGDPTASNYVPFAELQEETVIGWVKGVLGEAEVTAIETALQDAVTARKAEKDAETEKNGLPWL